MRSGTTVVANVLNGIGAAFREGWRPQGLTDDEVVAMNHRRMVVSVNARADQLAAQGAAPISVDSSSDDSDGVQDSGDVELPPEQQTWRSQPPEISGFEDMPDGTQGWLLNLGFRRLHRAVVKAGSPSPACGCQSALRSQWFALADKPSEDGVSRCGRPACARSPNAQHGAEEWTEPGIGLG